MNLGKALKALKFDNRMIDWNLTQGLVTKDELTSFDSSLEDVASRSLPVDLEGEKRGGSAAGTNQQPGSFGLGS